MAKINVNTAERDVLDYLVAKCEGKVRDCEVHAGNIWYGRVTSGFIQYKPSTDWAQGGPIIAREWDILSKESTCVSGDELLRHYMRCYVASKLGDEVEVPDELLSK